MKTITLDETTYSPLPELGTMGAFLNFVESRGSESEKADALLESSIEEQSSEKNDPWI